MSAGPTWIAAYDARRLAEQSVERLRWQEPKRRTSLAYGLLRCPVPVYESGKLTVPRGATQAAIYGALVHGRFETRG